MSKKKRRPVRPQRPPAPAIPKALVAELLEARRLADTGRQLESLELLRSLDQVYPNRAEVLLALADAYYELHDYGPHSSVMERLVRLRPDDPRLNLALAGARLLNLRPVLALQTFRQFLERWPDDEQADVARQTIEEMEPAVNEMLATTGLTGEDAFELAMLHEESQSLMQQGRTSQARRVAEELLRRRPDFIPALNNLSLIHRMEGDVQRAIEAAERVLSLAPENHHALANLTHYLMVSGRLAESRRAADRLRALRTDAVDLWSKQAEAFSYLGDDEAVMEAFRSSREAAQERPPYEEALLLHLAAVATLRLGDEARAREYWRQALAADGGMDVVRDNLDDLVQPVAERHAPWAFGFPQWVPQQALRDLARQVESVDEPEGETALATAFRRYLAEHPHIEALVPVLLDRGDPAAREFGLRLALTSRTPTMLEALRDFAVSRRGPDSMRFDAARAASKAGLFPSDTVRLWLGGEWRETLLIGWELHSDPILRHSRRVEEWLLQAREAVDAGDRERADELFEKALAAEPDAPDLLYDRAMSLGRQGRVSEAEAAMQGLFERHPDFPIARAGLAQILARRGELEHAKELIQPLLQQERLHFTEFGTLCSAQIEIGLAESNREEAQTWVNLLAAADPDNPALPYWRRRIGGR